MEENYVLACVCGSGCPCRHKDHYTHLNLVKKVTLENGIDPSTTLETKWINVRGREEHENIIRDAQWCKELGLDQHYEIMVYLKRWGSWLSK